MPVTDWVASMQLHGASPWSTSPGSARSCRSRAACALWAVTERQYARMKTLVGDRQAHEKPAGDQAVTPLRGGFLAALTRG
jgi:hypothetical protein